MKIPKKTYKEYFKSTEYKYKYLCYAPFNTLRFNEDGNVTACCLSNERILGNLFKDSLEDIIKGKSRKEMQREIKKNKLPDECGLCIIDMLNHNFDDIATKWYPPVKKRKNPPLILEFKTSLKCNLNCIMCSNSFRVDGSNETQLYPYDQNFRGEIKKLIPHLYSTTFNGGEPLIIDLYYDIWEDIIEINPQCNITIHTSLAVLPNRFKRILEKGNITIVASIDSLKKETYEQIRVNAIFDKMMDNLNYVLENKASGSETGLNFCPMNNNWQEIPDVIEFCNKKDLNFNFSIVYFPFTESLFNTNKETYHERLIWLENAYTHLSPGKNNSKYEAFLKRLQYFQEEVLNQTNYYQSKSEIISYLINIEPENEKIKEKVSNIAENLIEGTYFNFFQFFEKSYKRRITEILNETNKNDLQKNIISLIKSS